MALYFFASRIIVEEHFYYVVNFFYKSKNKLIKTPVKNTFLGFYDRYHLLPSKTVKQDTTIIVLAATETSKESQRHILNSVTSEAISNDASTLHFFYRQVSVSRV